MDRMTGLVVVVVVLAAASLFAWWRRRSQGRFQRTHEVVDTASPLTRYLHSGGFELGAQVTLVEFTSAFCAPCRAAKNVLDRVSADVDGLAVIEIDVAAQLDLVRAVGVTRTPTILVLDSTLTPVHRAVGVPRYADVVAAIGPHLLGAHDSDRGPGTIAPAPDSA